MRPEDLTGEAREVYEAWRGVGLSEPRALDEVRRSGLSGLPEQDGFDAMTQMFQTIGLSESEARAAAIGRDGSERQARWRFNEAEINAVAEKLTLTQAIEAAAQAFTAWATWLTMEDARRYYQDKVRGEWGHLSEVARKRNLVLTARALRASAAAKRR
ncbi:hypothetical protein ABZ801_15995 [Actinomadura sp. NPDC047616]|uniref:hypothetical protein n=1 Tax=Actinomadura sp. NPDC047616 TaxID=3155914 RepID=UPI0033C6D179